MLSLGSERLKISKQRQKLRLLLPHFFSHSFLKSAFPDCMDISSVVGVIGYVLSLPPFFSTV